MHLQSTGVLLTRPVIEARNAGDVSVRNARRVGDEIGNCKRSRTTYL